MLAATSTLRSDARFENALVPQAGYSQSSSAMLTGLYPHQAAHGKTVITLAKILESGPETAAAQIEFEQQAPGTNNRR
jgi:hypothetical protein